MKTSTFFIIILFLVITACKKSDTVIPTVKVTTLSSPVSGSINKMFFLTSSLGYAVCGNGTLLKTTDSGNSWNTVSSFPSTSFSLTDIEFPSSTVGFIFGVDNFSNGHLYQTTDKGIAWTEITMYGAASTSAVNFPTASRGYAISSTYQYISNDGGNSWATMSNFPITVFSPQLISFATRDTGYVTDANGVVYQTRNGGVNWTQISQPIGYARKIKFKSKTTGLAVDGVANIYRTTNGGSTWSLMNNPTSATQFALVGIDMASSTAFAVGDRSIFVSKDGGGTWEYRYNDLGANLSGFLTDVYMFNDNSGIACSSSGTFYKIELGSK